jgi:L-alanine-DL-glutamate epimerase-like enolase superfamily enzyme
MKIDQISVIRKNLKLQKPYAIAGRIISDVENICLMIRLENGIIGYGAANPAPEVVGESPAEAEEVLNRLVIPRIKGRDIRSFWRLIRETQHLIPKNPGALAALDIALHDAYGKWAQLPITAIYGKYFNELPTSVTIGIMDVEETIKEAGLFFENKFSVFKIKTGEDLVMDISRLKALREVFGDNITLRVDANQGYSVSDLTHFLDETASMDIELIEQPFKVGHEKELLKYAAFQRASFCADESLKSVSSIFPWLQDKPFGIFNIKLMKCGGILNAMDIGRIADEAGITLFWGCNDESCISISAALHAAFANKNTRYIDLDGSFDLGEDFVKGGFYVKEGKMGLFSDRFGLGFENL